MLNTIKEINKKDLFIECIGLPGAGKTTTISNINNTIKGHFNLYIKSKGEADLLYRSSKTKLLRNLEIVLFLMSNINLFFILVKSVFYLRLSKQRLAISFLIIEAFASVEAFKKKSKHVNNHIVDEGILQYIGSLVVPSKNENSFIPEELINQSISRVVDGIIFIKTPISVSINRIKLRNSGRSRFDFMEESEARRNLAIMNEVFSHCVSIAKKKDVPVLEINAEDTVNDKVDSINKWVTMFFL